MTGAPTGGPGSPDKGDGQPSGLTQAISAEIAEDEFTAAIARLTHRRVVAFMSASQSTPGIAAELFLLDAVPLAAATGPMR